ncbi:twin-arginine translocase TatA/TatE family subunit [Deinococcus sp.]|uniref:Sec-independent protein translocase subunit TatA/TatB n=1 Tax=Deinococcus sp. TaxID=47478 RepID=UPI0025B7B820|nr:twin-arginine translocase TatA/TatE family subunit [Deinococcus sp.]
MNAPGIPEILFILVIALVVFGPRKLPELGKSLGAGLREFRRSTQGLKEEFEGVMSDTRTESHAVSVSPAQPPAQVQVIAAMPQVIRAQDVTPPEAAGQETVAGGSAPRQQD